MNQDFKSALQEATQAYLDVWRKHNVNFANPITKMRDKQWSEVLRAVWPDYTTVDVKKDNGLSYSDKRRWCDEKPGGYWVNGGGDRWYFERRDIAALFKLTFGGAQ
jgi:hypothetical protein